MGCTSQYFCQAVTAINERTPETSALISEKILTGYKWKQPFKFKRMLYKLRSKSAQGKVTVHHHQVPGGRRSLTSQEKWDLQPPLRLRASSWRCNKVTEENHQGSKSKPRNVPGETLLTQLQSSKLTPSSQPTYRTAGPFGRENTRK